MSYVVWLTGISGAGKSTLGRRLEAYLKSQNQEAVFLDGDVIREFFEGDLGYSRAERVQNVRRVVFGAYLLARQGVTVIVANMAPYYEVRDFIRRKLDAYLQIYVKASVEVVSRRDVKGIYQEYANSGERGGGKLVGVDDEYEEPRSPDLTVYTDEETEEESFKKVLELLKERGIYGDS